MAEWTHTAQIEHDGTLADPWGRRKKEEKFKVILHYTNPPWGPYLKKDNFILVYIAPEG